MCRCIATFLLWAVVIFSIWPDARLFGDNEPPREPAENSLNNAEEMAQKSDKAVVKEVVYGLEIEDRRLQLTSQPLDGADRRSTRTELEFTIPVGERAVEMSLAKLNGKNLMAVIKVARGAEFDFHCLTLIAPAGGHVRDRFRFHKAKFFTTQDDLGILAVGGRHFSGSVFIVLGEIDCDFDKDVQVTSGAFYFSRCPWPPLKLFA